MTGQVLLHRILGLLSSVRNWLVSRRGAHGYGALDLSCPAASRLSQSFQNSVGPEWVLNVDDFTCLLCGRLTLVERALAEDQEPTRIGHTFLLGRLGLLEKLPSCLICSFLRVIRVSRLTRSMECLKQELPGPILSPVTHS